MKDYQASHAHIYQAAPVLNVALSDNMTTTNPQTAQANALVLIASEAQARRNIAKLSDIPSGAVPVLALLVYRHQQGHNSRPKAIYAAKIANEPLIRSYLRQLIAAKLVMLNVCRGCRWLSPTLDGTLLAAKYYRALRMGRLQIEMQD